MNQRIDRWMPLWVVAGMLAWSGCSDDGSEMESHEPRVWQGELSGPVEVVRDAYGVPHLRASSMLDLAYAQGFEMARDRWFHMDWLRRFLYGRRAEVFGAAYLADDRVKRAVGIRQIAEGTLAHLQEHDPYVVELLRAFTAGVNDQLAAMRAGAAGSPRPQEFDRIEAGYWPEPWEVVDSVAVGRGLIFSQNFQLELELAWGLANWAIGGTRTSELLPFTPLFATHIFEEAPSSDTLLSLGESAGGAAAMVQPRLLRSVEGPIPEEAMEALASLALRLAEATGRTHVGGYGGSNAWALAGSRVEGGGAVLCNDTHMDMNLPSTLYPVHLELTGRRPFRATGYIGPGLPLVLIGATEHVAWGLTNPFTDMNDLYVEQYGRESLVRDGQQIPFETRTEVIRVRREGGNLADVDEEVVTLRRSPGRGPLLADLLPREIGQLLALAGFTYSVRWTGFATDVNDFAAFLSMLYARDVEEQLEALEAFESGAIQWTLADAGGRVATLIAGRFPRRPADGAPYVAYDGRTSEADWQGWMPFEEVPRLVDPAKGYVVAANNAANVGPMDNRPEVSPFYYHHFADLGTRAYRITSLIEAEGVAPISFDRLRSYQADNHSVLAEVLLPHLLPVLRDACSASSPEEAHLCEPVAILDAWDLRQDVESAGATLFNAWMAQFFYTFFQRQVTNVIIFRLVARDLINVGGRSIGNWLSGRTPPSGTDYFQPWDGVGPWEEGMSNLMWLSWGAGVERLTSFFGERPPEDWAWGDAHVALHRHRVWPDLSRGPYRNDSGARTVNAADFFVADGDGNLLPLPFQQYEAPQIRFCAHLRPGSAPLVYGGLKGGVSGHIGSPHYDDQLEAWVANETRARATSVDAARTEPGASAWTLMP